MGLAAGLFPPPAAEPEHLHSPALGALPGIVPKDAEDASLHPGLAFDTPHALSATFSAPQLRGLCPSRSFWHKNHLRNLSGPVLTHSLGDWINWNHTEMRALRHATSDFFSTLSTALPFRRASSRQNAGQDPARSRSSPRPAKSASARASVSEAFRDSGRSSRIPLDRAYSRNAMSTS